MKVIAIITGVSPTTDGSPGCLIGMTYYISDGSGAGGYTCIVDPALNESQIEASIKDQFSAFLNSQIEGATFAASDVRLF